MYSNQNYMRSVSVVIIFCMVYLIIGINLYFIQIRQAPFFKHLGEKQYNVTVQTHPERGTIYDRHNQPLVLNNDAISAFILPKELVETEKLLTFLQTKFPQAYERFNGYKHKSFMFIKRNLSEEEQKSIQKENNSNIHLLKESSRYYPYEALSTIIGITDIDNNGLFGIEQQYNSLLQGSPTTYSLQKDAKLNHFYFSKETKAIGAQAESVNLTIDADLQFKFYDILKDTVDQHDAKEAAALALDPETGEILTMVSYPSFDPNNTKELLLDHTKNRPISECFETGSVIKVFAALASLEEKVTHIDEIIDCEDTKETKLDNIKIRTVVPHGKIPFIDVIKLSNNIGIVKVTKRLHTDLYDYYKLLGFGELTGSNIVGEQKGFVNHPDHWSAYSIQSLSYGYEITTSLLQLARAFSVIVNNGYLITPTIIQRNETEKIGPIVSQESILDIQKILQATIETGTGKRAKISGYTIIGKTGTSNLLDDGQYNDKKHLYTFIGAIQQEAYKRVIVAYVKESKTVSYSSLIAAPLFRKLAEATLLHDQILHDI